jgi:hypothetical protein
MLAAMCQTVKQIKVPNKGAIIKANDGGLIGIDHQGL